MARNFYYGADARIVAGSAIFASLIDGNASMYGLSTEQAARYVAADALLQETYRRAITPATRTPVAVREKDDARNLVQRDAARLAQIMYATETVNDGQLMTLGLQPRAVRTARSVPPTPPIVEVVSVMGRRVRVRFRAASSAGAGKAEGALGVQVYSFVGNEPATNARQYRYEGLASRSTYEIVFPNDVASGATVWISAAWVSRRGETSVACAPRSVTIQGGPVLATAG